MQRCVAMPDLRPLLSPKSLASSARRPTSSLRGRLTKQLIGHGFDGPIYPVTRSQSEVLGHKAYRSVADIPGAGRSRGDRRAGGACHLDDRAMRRRAASRPRSIICSGFGEEKSEEAAQRDAAAARARRRSSTWRSAGRIRRGWSTRCARWSRPSARCSTTPRSRCCPQGSKAKPIAVSCQSGALTFSFLSRGRDAPAQIHLLRSARATRPCSKRTTISSAALDAGGADIFLVYLEGIRQPARFRAVADKAARAGKPLIVAKVGRSDAGRRAAASHTGALAQSGAIDDAIFRHHGIIRGEDIDHMVDVATAFAFCKLPQGQPRRDHHRLGRQRGVDGRHPVGARARSAGARRRPPGARSWRCCRPTPRR